MTSTARSPHKKRIILTFINRFMLHGLHFANLLFSLGLPSLSPFKDLKPACKPTCRRPASAYSLAFLLRKVGRQETMVRQTAPYGLYTSQATTWRIAPCDLYTSHPTVCTHRRQQLDASHPAICTHRTPDLYRPFTKLPIVWKQTPYKLTTRPPDLKDK